MAVFPYWGEGGRGVRDVCACVLVLYYRVKEEGRVLRVGRGGKGYVELDEICKM